jgi:toxin ParE1/3/4
LKIRLIFPADIELDEAVRFYDHQLPGLGFRFFQETEAAIERMRNIQYL